MRPGRQPVSPTLSIVVGIAAVSTSSIFIRLAQSEASSISIAAFRLTLASLVLLPMAATRHRSEIKALSRRDFGLALGSGFFLAIHFASWISSLAFTSVASSIVFVSTLPLWVSLLSPLLLKERIRSSTIIGLAISFTGSVVIAISDFCTIGDGFVCPPLTELVSAKAFVGDALALLGAISGAGYMLIGRNLRDRLSNTAYVSLVYGASAVVLVGLAIVTHQPILGFSPQTYLWLVLLALVPQLLGHSSFNYALGFLPASIVSLTFLGEPVGTVILAYLVLEEVPGIVKGVGAILILTGIWVASRNNNTSP